MTGHGTGYRVDRRYTGGPQEQVNSAEQHARRVSTQLPLLRRAVVVDVFYDPVAQLTQSARERLVDEVANPELVDRIRRNCIVARTITGELDRQNDRPSIFFPLFDPYLAVAVKPGEQVFIIHEDPAVGADVGYWLCRIPEPIDVDDVNYTHGDRRYQHGVVGGDTLDELAGVEPPRPGFPNGSGDEDSLTIGGPDEYERIVDEASAMRQFTMEPVPRWTGRPGDSSLQGSNNTLIALTTERRAKATNVDDVGTGKGAIYIAAGRGRGTNTPNVVKNERDVDEVDKTPALRGLTDVESEGDPDYKTDASVIYMSMNSDVDADDMFDINVQNGGEASDVAAPSIVVKTDQLRLIGRNDVKIQAGENGVGAAIVLTKSGDIILIPGPGGVIKLGGADSDHAVLGNTGVAGGGKVVGLPIITTMGGVAGTPAADPHGSFGTKVLIKV